MATTWWVGRQLLWDLSEVERDLRQAEVHTTGRTVSPSQLRQYHVLRREAESALSHHSYRILMALQHAQEDRSGEVFAWLLHEVHRGTPAMSIRINDGTMATSQLAINSTFRDYYRQLYEKLTTSDMSHMLDFLKGVSLPSLTATQRNTVEEPIQMEEIKEAIPQIARNKTPAAGLGGPCSRPVVQETTKYHHQPLLENQVKQLCGLVDRVRAAILHSAHLCRGVHLNADRWVVL
ncbi:hypothetical protein NDU88_004468 [Pleurodeles waltl]|uniref:Uncharacterized protein n=1 Tax=Pleurodeles waltl TaxID=8319 RepID=A0AAV7PG35_PLEWA|nr:hypothetical protein NDU88_004468 [Pleurodeles waltl]